MKNPHDGPVANTVEGHQAEPGRLQQGLRTPRLDDLRDGHVSRWVSTKLSVLAHLDFQFGNRIRSVHHQACCHDNVATYNVRCFPLPLALVCSTAAFSPTCASSNANPHDNALRKRKRVEISLHGRETKIPETRVSSDSQMRYVAQVH